MPEIRPNHTFFIDMLESIIYLRKVSLTLSVILTYFLTLGFRVRFS
jgi:hypothetical protein